MILTKNNVEDVKESLKRIEDNKIYIEETEQ